MTHWSYRSSFCNFDSDLDQWNDSLPAPAYPGWGHLQNLVKAEIGSFGYKQLTMILFDSDVRKAILEQGDKLAVFK